MGKKSNEMRKENGKKTERGGKNCGSKKYMSRVATGASKEWEFRYKPLGVLYAVLHICVMLSSLYRIQHYDGWPELVALQSTVLF